MDDDDPWCRFPVPTAEGVPLLFFHARLASAKTRAARRTTDEAFTHEITAIHVASRQTHGVPRTHAELRRVGQRVNRERVARVNAEGTG
ncbi:IS3 family transposase [Streptomyces mirabilis]|jgi:hypothetical protein|uniref:IS3 family transposase n=1 Tax=Streptomyces mirabilis TaxID=68239 RepID=UPI00333360DE